MNKKLLKVAVLLMLVGTLLIGCLTSVYAGYYGDRKVSMKGYSLAGINVVTVTLHASGYSYDTWGDVTDVWMTVDKCYIFNEVTDEKTWTASHPVGEYAKGSFKAKVGVPSPWGTIGTSGTTHTLSILF